MTSTQRPGTPAADRRVPSAWTSVRAQVATAGVVCTLIVLLPRWDGAPRPVAAWADGLPSALAGLPLWSAAVGVVVALAATVSLVLARRG